MRFRANLQEKLVQRYQQVHSAGFNFFGRSTGYLVQFIKATPALNSIVSRLERTLPDLDPAEWVATNFSMHQADWPDSEVGRAKVAWHLVQRFTESAEDGPMFGHDLDPSTTNLDNGARTASQQVVAPLVEYLLEQLGEAAELLYLLERYVRRVEWFRQKPLWAEYQANTSRGEDVYDRDLREFLFDQGIDYPFSQPRSASGQADVVANLETDEPLVCELKLFDAGNYGKRYLAQGVQQAVAYARDYGKSEAYLVIVNLSEKHLSLPNDEPSEWPPRIDVAGITVFLVSVRGRPQESASKRGTAEVVEVSKDDLVKFDDE